MFRQLCVPLLHFLAAYPVAVVSLDETLMRREGGQDQAHVHERRWMIKRDEGLERHEDRAPSWKDRHLASDGPRGLTQKTESGKPLEVFASAHLGRFKFYGLPEPVDYHDTRATLEWIHKHHRKSSLKNGITANTLILSGSHGRSGNSGPCEKGDCIVDMALERKFDKRDIRAGKFIEEDRKEADAAEKNKFPGKIRVYDLMDLLNGFDIRASEATNRKDAERRLKLLIKGKNPDGSHAGPEFHHIMVATCYGSKSKLVAAVAKALN